MIIIFGQWLQVFWSTVSDVVPIVIVLFGFQIFVLRQPIVHLGSVISGFIYVILGLSLFLLGLELALFPLGENMAIQLTSPQFLYGSDVLPDSVDWTQYYWVYIFAATVGFSTAIAEPSLLAVAIKANEVSGGAIKVNGLRLSVATGVAIGISLGSYRIIVGDPIHYYIIIGYLIVMIQTFMAPKMIVPLAYDSGGVATSTVTVPLVTALGLGLASTIPGRNPALDGFGLIAFACLFPIITVMAYAQIAQWKVKRNQQIVEKQIKKQQEIKEINKTNETNETDRG